MSDKDPTRPEAAASPADDEQSPPASGPQPKRPRLLERVRELIRARHYSRRTERAYVAWIRRYILFHGARNPAHLGGPELTQFLSDLATRAHVSASTQNQAFSALLFLYRDVLERELQGLEQVVRAKLPTRLPLLLGREEVSPFFVTCAAPVS